jgi:hypothetical protein
MKSHPRRDGMANREQNTTGEHEIAVVDIWAFAVDPAVRASDVIGFSVEATDGGIGNIDEATDDETGRGHLIVDTGHWIFGKKVMLPAGVVDHIDLDSQTVYVKRTKDEIKHAPEFLPDGGVDDDYRDRLGTYYR